MIPTKIDNKAYYDFKNAAALLKVIQNLIAN